MDELFGGHGGGRHVLEKNFKLNSCDVGSHILYQIKYSNQDVKISNFSTCCLLWSLQLPNFGPQSIFLYTTFNFFFLSPASSKINLQVKRNRGSINLIPLTSQVMSFSQTSYSIDSISSII
jgi:hypothetical protein